MFARAVTPVYERLVCGAVRPVVCGGAVGVQAPPSKTGSAERDEGCQHRTTVTLIGLVIWRSCSGRARADTRFGSAPFLPSWRFYLWFDPGFGSLGPPQLGAPARPWSERPQGELDPTADACGNSCLAAWRVLGSTPGWKTATDEVNHTRRHRGTISSTGSVFNVCIRSHGSTEAQLTPGQLQ